MTIAEITEAPPLQSAGKFTDEMALDWLAANPNTSKTVRELAGIWGWHRSRVFRFLSRFRETKGETKALSRETSETRGETSETSTDTLQLKLGPASRAIVEPPQHDDFDWADDADIVIEEQPRTALYINPRNSVVIRQSRWPEDEDAIVIITRENLRALIRRLQEIAEEKAA